MSSATKQAIPSDSHGGPEASFGSIVYYASARTWTSSVEAPESNPRGGDRERAKPRQLAIIRATLCGVRSASYRPVPPRHRVSAAAGVTTGDDAGARASVAVGGQWHPRRRGARIES